MNTYAPATRPAQPRAEATNLDIAAFILAIFIPIAGMIMGYVSRGQAKRAGMQPCTLSTWTIVLGWIFTVAAVAVTVLLTVAISGAALRTGYCLNHISTPNC